ncbi:ribonuclease HI family protein [Candidatus Sumerlaeota bacterium]|nr:ribonuclease HI family protein [Candidatus Sumerlaeota bacterium]
MTEKKLPKTIKVFTDGCAKGNPGPAGIGYVFEDIEGNVLDEGCGYLGEATNNEAEYNALIAAMERCAEKGIKAAFFFTDSQLMAHQINGIYKIKNARIAQLAKKVQTVRKKFDKFQLTYVPREQNRRADKLANKGVEAVMKEAAGLKEV